MKKVLRISCWLLAASIQSLLPGHACAQAKGCTDPLAQNFNPAATVNDGSCTYASAMISPLWSVQLDGKLSETSGLVLWNQFLWSHNDDNDANLYALAPSNGAIAGTYPLPGVMNTDWEDIAQDSAWIYLGDLGNNSNGNRKDLHLLRVSKQSILVGPPRIDTIWFSYSDQTNFAAAGANNTDFDCEAFIVGTDSIYLFTKQWVSRRTRVYALPKTPGNHIARPKSDFDVQGLVTGATYLPEKRLVELCGYTPLLQPFLWLLYDFAGDDFFGANKRKLDLALPFHQVEAIASADGLSHYCSNETFSRPPLNIPQRLHLIDLSAYLGNYLDRLSRVPPDPGFSFQASISPNPVAMQVHIQLTDKTPLPVRYAICDLRGNRWRSGKLDSQSTVIDLAGLPAGAYVVTIEGGHSIRLIKE